MDNKNELVISYKEGDSILFDSYGNQYNTISYPHNSENKYNSLIKNINEPAIDCTTNDSMLNIVESQQCQTDFDDLPELLDCSDDDTTTLDDLPELLDCPDNDTTNIDDLPKLLNCSDNDITNIDDLPKLLDDPNTGLSYYNSLIVKFVCISIGFVVGFGIGHYHTKK
jgi:hypothetical protein